MTESVGGHEDTLRTDPSISETKRCESAGAQAHGSNGNDLDARIGSLYAEQ